MDFFSLEELCWLSKCFGFWNVCDLGFSYEGCSTCSDLLSPLWSSRCQRSRGSHSLEEVFPGPASQTVRWPPTSWPVCRWLWRVSHLLRTVFITFPLTLGGSARAGDTRPLTASSWHLFHGFPHFHCSLQSLEGIVVTFLTDAQFLNWGHILYYLQ